MTKKSTYRLILLFVLVLGTFGLANDKAAEKQDKASAVGLANDKAADKQDKAKAVSGKITAVDDKSLTIQTIGDQPETITFSLDTKTTKPSNLTVGSEVMVEYKDEADKKIATNIVGAK